MSSVPLVVVALPLIALLVLAGAPPGDAQETPRLTVVASEDGFLQEGDVEVVAGSDLVVVFRNEDENPHSVHVRDAATADPARTDTATEGELASSAVLRPDDQVQLFVVVPEDTDSLYLWCDIAGHEAVGHWLAVPVVDPDEAGGDGGGAGGSRDASGPPVVGALVAAVLVAIGVRHGGRPLAA